MAEWKNSFVRENILFFNDFFFYEYVLGEIDASNAIQMLMFAYAMTILCGLLLLVEETSTHDRVKQGQRWNSERFHFYIFTRDHQLLIVFVLVTRFDH